MQVSADGSYGATHERFHVRVWRTEKPTRRPMHLLLTKRVSVCPPYYLQPAHHALDAPVVSTNADACCSRRICGVQKFEFEPMPLSEC